MLSPSLILSLIVDVGAAVLKKIVFTTYTINLSLTACFKKIYEKQH